MIGVYDPSSGSDDDDKETTLCQRCPVGAKFAQLPQNKQPGQTRTFDKEVVKHTHTHTQAAEFI